MQTDKGIQNHLLQLSKINNFPPNHILYLQRLKASGFEPRVIYDIGACVLHWTNQARLLWPDATYILFDAFEEAGFLYKDGGYRHFIGVLSDVTGKEVKWYQNTMMPGGNSYYRENNSSVFPENAFKVRTSCTLDDVVHKNQFPLPDLVKIDVQGCEKDIVVGGRETLKAAKHLIIEMQNTDYNLGAPKANETLPFIENFLEVKCVAPLFCDNGADGDYGFSSSSTNPVLPPSPK